MDYFKFAVENARREMNEQLYVRYIRSQWRSNFSQSQKVVTDSGANALPLSEDKSNLKAERD